MCSTLIREFRVIILLFTLLFHLHFPQRQKMIDERKTKVLLGIYKHLGPNSNVMNFFFHTFSLWIPLIHECIGHWSNVLLSWPTLHNRVNSFPKEHSWLGALFNDPTRDSIANKFVISAYCRCLQILYQIDFFYKI